MNWAIKEKLLSRLLVILPTFILILQGSLVQFATYTLIFMAVNLYIGLLVNSRIQVHLHKSASSANYTRNLVWKILVITLLFSFISTFFIEINNKYFSSEYLFILIFLLCFSSFLGAETQLNYRREGLFPKIARNSLIAGLISICMLLILQSFYDLLVSILIYNMLYNFLVALINKLEAFTVTEPQPHYSGDNLFTTYLLLNLSFWFYGFFDRIVASVILDDEAFGIYSIIIVISRTLAENFATGIQNALKSNSLGIGRVKSQVHSQLQNYRDKINKIAILSLITTASSAVSVAYLRAELRPFLWHLVFASFAAFLIVHQSTSLTILERFEPKLIIRITAAILTVYIIFLVISSKVNISIIAILVLALVLKELITLIVYTLSANKLITRE